MNQPKTVLAKIMSHQKQPRITGDPPQLSVRKPGGTIKLITPDKQVRLLGGNIQENLSWQAHLETGEKPLLPELRKKLGALRHPGTGVPRRTRLRLANSIIMSRLIICCQSGGGECQKNTWARSKFFKIKLPDMSMDRGECPPPKVSRSHVIGWE